MVKRYSNLLVALIALVSCQDYNPMENRSPELGVYFEDGKNFDFSTTRAVQLDVNYGRGLGAKTYVQIYDQCPEEGDTTLLPLYTAVTDAEGRIQCRTFLPTYVKEVWLVCYHIGLPWCVKCPVVDGRIAYEYDSPLLRAEGGVTRAGSEPDNTDYRGRVTLVNESKKLYTIVSWDDQFGTVNDSNNPGIVTTDQTVSTDQYNSYAHHLERALWKGSDTRPTVTDKGNNVFALGSNIVNTKTLATYTNDEGDEVEVESVSLNFVFLTEWGWYQNVMGYYYYKTSEAATVTAANVKKFICLPNASRTGHPPYPGDTGSANHQANQAPAYAGESISLLFEKEDGTFTKNFPPGYTVGYFLMSNGFVTKNKTTGTINTDVIFYYSNEAWNGGTKRYLALSLPNDGGIVYGVEDGTDNSYDDVMFMIQGTPNEAIHNPDIPTINPEEETILYWHTSHQTYAFEDIWPNGGDYDLNDVIIEHEREVEYDNEGKLSIVEDDFTLTEAHATYHDAFAIQLNNNWLGTSLTIEKDGVDITSSVKNYTDAQNSGAKTYILFEDLQQLTVGTTFRVTRKFSDKPGRTAFEAAEPKVNPFIISQYTDADYTAGAMTEIHIPDFGNRTSKAKTDNSTGSEYYYVARHGNNTYPFALSLPVKAFVASPEGVSIDQTYSGFNDWVTSGGTESDDWYHHHGSESVQ